MRTECSHSQNIINLCPNRLQQIIDYFKAVSSISPQALSKYTGSTGLKDFISLDFSVEF